MFVVVVEGIKTRGGVDVLFCSNATRGVEAVYLRLIALTHSVDVVPDVCMS